MSPVRFSSPPRPPLGLLSGGRPKLWPIPLIGRKIPLQLLFSAEIFPLFRRVAEFTGKSLTLQVFRRRNRLFFAPDQRFFPIFPC